MQMLMFLAVCFDLTLYFGDAKQAYLQPDAKFSGIYIYYPLTDMTWSLTQF